MRHALARRQLLLVLDLDHTLLNSARFTDLTQPQGELLQQLEGTQHAQHGANRSLKRFDHMAMWTKLRPYVRLVVAGMPRHAATSTCREFLKEVSQLFELYIYTMGDRDYAAEMAAFLDPEGQYFRGRTISKVVKGCCMSVGSSRCMYVSPQNDSTAAHAKQLDVVLGVDHMVVIIDDTDAVWPNNKGNLMQIARYAGDTAQQRIHEIAKLDTCFFPTTRCALPAPPSAATWSRAPTSQRPMGPSLAA